MFKKRQPKEKVVEKDAADSAGGYDVDKGRPAEEKVDSKKRKKSSRPTLSFNEEEVFTSDADTTTTVADGTSDPARSIYFKVKNYRF